ncbi:MAG: putative transcriptional regulator (toxin/antitoxin system) [Candidatus Tokpelaia sp. JSC188]|nr:MAG: putative transcriptional regulator (toxin/antitoxin system) [Candidatus Tokpelaia sp. JSC188]
MKIKKMTVISKISKEKKNDIKIGAIVREKRLALNISQDALARNLGITRHQLYKHETGKNRISAGRLAVIAKVFNLPISTFYAIETKSENEKFINLKKAQEAAGDITQWLTYLIPQEKLKSSRQLPINENEGLQFVWSRLEDLRVHFKAAFPGGKE